MKRRRTQQVAGCLGCRQRNFAEYQLKMVGFRLLDGSNLGLYEGLIEDAAVLHAESSDHHELWPKDIS